MQELRKLKVVIYKEQLMISISHLKLIRRMPIPTTTEVLRGLSQKITMKQLLISTSQ